MKQSGRLTLSLRGEINGGGKVDEKQREKKSRREA
jgi:hypothetical protein